MHRTLSPIALALFTLACEAPSAEVEAADASASAPATGSSDAPIVESDARAVAGVYLPRHVAAELGCEGPNADQTVQAAVASCAGVESAKPAPAACPDPSDRQLKGNPQLAELVSACALWMDVALQSATSGGMPVFDGPTVLRTFDGMAALLGQPNKQIALSFDADLGYIDQIAIRTADGSAWHTTDIDVMSIWDEGFSQKAPVY